MLRSKRTIAILLISLLVVAVVVSLSVGAYPIAPKEVVSILFSKIGIDTGVPFEHFAAEAMNNRMSRVLLSILVGAALAVSGAALQGIFRNPLVDSGLIGIASGASFFAALYILLGSSIPFLLSGNPALTLAFVAFLGAILTTMLVYRISRFQQTIQITLLILAGVALNAIAGSLTGMIQYLADESQLRDLTFWTLGSLGGANWTSLAILLPFVAIPMVVLFYQSSALNAFALGEQSAYFLGINTRKVKLLTFLSATAMVGASVSFVGAIGFIGLVIPHILRALIGPDHRCLLPMSAIAGALLLCLS
ncbi:MAG TPA: iron ABC transporter permease, partial [Candidatus Nitrosocosmicus sp.]|nr:iron ABC transporter permease [Candidatus Nitrosocosmicus sp.]